VADQFPGSTKMVLSPAAQAIAWSQCPMREGFKCLPQPCPQCRKQGAAALRAAADQVVSPIPDDCTADVFNRQLKIRSELYAIATELDPN